MKLSSRLCSLVCLGIAVVISGSLYAQKPATGLARGSWSGRATGSDSKTFSVTVSLNGNGGGFVEYPSLKCGGSLRYFRRNGDAYSYRETITHGESHCGAAGTIDLVPDGTQLDWTKTAGGQKSTATLTIPDNPGPNACATCELNYDQNYLACDRMTNSDDKQKCRDRADDDLRTCEGACTQ
jgi:hypothetical protein